jgi:imidazoleglycerol-phosphate dehydratase
MRVSEVVRTTAETDIRVVLGLDGSGKVDVATGIGFFDHMLTLFGVHGFFDLTIAAKGDLHVDDHHSVEDVGLALGEALNQGLGDRRGIRRFGHAVTPMDEALAAVSIDLSNRPFLVYRLPEVIRSRGAFDAYLAKEFFRAFATRAGMALHIDVGYGENEHHIIEAIFKTTGRALDRATSIDPRIVGVPSSKGTL